MPALSAAATALQSKIWNGSLALEIRLAPSDCRTYAESEPYLIQYPRLSYIAFLLPRLHGFFTTSLIDPEVSPHQAWLSFEEVPLKWHYPTGLLYDLFSGVEPADAENHDHDEPSSMLHGTGASTVDRTPAPWRLTIHYSDFPTDRLLTLDAEGKTMHDTFVNSVKEADFVRNGTARTFMSLSKSDSDDLWKAVQQHNLSLFNTINSKLLNPPGMELRHVPMKIYLPTSARQATTDTIEEESKPGHLKVVQSLVPLTLPSKQPQTLGTALNSVLPSVFPSRRNPIYARPVLHGAAVPLNARIDELGRIATYTDGFLHIAVAMHA